MAYNGSGTFLVNSAGQPVVTGTVISSTAFNALTADLATGLSTAITKDGQTTPTANIKLGGFKLTNVGTATTAGDALVFGSGTNSSTLAVPTRQVLTSGTTYTTPANVRQLRVRMVGGGGGGNCGGGTPGSAGTTTTFNSIVANGGSGANSPGTGATTNSGNGTGTASLRVVGAANSLGMNVGTQNMPGGQGGSGAFGGGGGGSGWWAAAASTAGSVNSGGGGGGGSTAANSGGGGGSGEYVEIIINSPTASYTYAIGGGGAAGNTGASFNASAGGSGVIIVDEFY